MAQKQKGFVLDRFEPSERGSQWFVLDSLDMRGHLRPAAGVVGSWSHEPLVVYDRDGHYVSSLVEHQLFVHPGASLALWNRARAAISLPLGVYQTGAPVTIGTKTYAPPEASVGDLRLSADARLFNVRRGVITGALGLALYLPTGSRADYTSDGWVRVLPRATVAGDIAMFTYSARVGFHYRALTERFERNPLGSELVYGVAAGIRVAKRRLVLGPELFGSSIVDEESFLRRRGSPSEIVIGAHYTLSDFRFGAGAGTGLSRGWGTPEMRTFLSAEWAPDYVPDEDKDGVPDAEDACPTVRGVRTKDPKTNGCPPPPPAPPPPPPPPPDRDHDGIIDAVDACPELAGDQNADPKKHGCPPDRDNDGVFDLEDACPDVAGKKHSDPKKNGCPPDMDNDGIPDDKDACPETPGEKNEDPLRNGCPSDRDNDGAWDNEDACPDAPGPADPDPKRNGCPLARVEAGQIKIVEQIRFKFGSAEILRDSDPTLLAVAATMKDHPEITKLRVEGHTDDKGRDDTNYKLSTDRAEAVMKWLVSAGIERKRLESMGLGKARPIDSNKTEEGRQNNRRVEFHIMKKTKPAPKAPAKP